MKWRVVTTSYVADSVVDVLGNEVAGAMERTTLRLSSCAASPP